jgi:Flp pilus assembly protein TadD
MLGYNYLNDKKIDEAIKVFKENVERFPNSANVYDSLGEAYENNNQFAEAEKNYKKAVELAKPQNHQNLGIYKKNLKRMEERLAQDSL